MQCFDVLRSGRQLRHHLHELGPGFLVLLEHCGERHAGARRPRPPGPAAPRRGARTYLAAPASDSWRPRHQLGGARLVRARPASPRRGRPRRPLGLRREPGLSVYPRLPGNRPEPERSPLAATAVPGVTSGRGARAPRARSPSTGQLSLCCFPDVRSSPGGRGSRAPSRVTPYRHRSPPGGQGVSQTEPGGSPTRPGTRSKCGETSKLLRWSRLGFDGGEKSHIGHCVI